MAEPTAACQIPWCHVQAMGNQPCTCVEKVMLICKPSGIFIAPAPALRGSSGVGIRECDAEILL